MHDQTIPTSRVIAAAFWALAVICIAAMWLVFGAGHEHLAMALAGTGTLFVGFAVVAHLRCYAIRAMKTLRLIGGLDDSRPTAELHRVR